MTAGRLDVVMTERGLARSRSQAADLIAGGKVRVDDAVVTKASAKVGEGQRLRVDSPDHYVSRAAHKLIAALDEFEIDVRDVLALDLGASTGGFTQVLVERGAARVIALDVGHGQLAPELRASDRVRVVEHVNARELTQARLAEVSGIDAAPAVVVADLSFISLTLILPAIAEIAPDGTEIVLLIKPQFEVGRAGLRDGIVKDPARADAAVARVCERAEELGFARRGIVPSPIAGEHGNREFLAYFVTGNRAEAE